MANFLPFVIILMILAVVLRAEPALTVVYLIIGTFGLSLWLNKRAFSHLSIRREHPNHVFLGEEIPITLKINNKSFLPLLWLELHESLPVNLRAGRSVKKVLHLGAKTKKEINYSISGRKRGYYSLGPLSASSGDPLGLAQPSQNKYPESYLTVYPQIVTLHALGLPSHSPFGLLKHHNPVFEDPSRVMGKRGFQYGDSIRQIDWKSTAATDQLQVKLYEASIALDIAILLDLHRDSYEMKSFYDATELAVITAASFAAWGQTHQQTIGLHTNGNDPLQENTNLHFLLPKKGAAHFINILEVLARVQPGNHLSQEALMQRALANFSWGTTLVLITGVLQETTFTQLFTARKRGLNPVIILTAPSPNLTELREQSAYYKIPLHKVTYPHHLSKMSVG